MSSGKKSTRDTSSGNSSGGGKKQSVFARLGSFSKPSGKSKLSKSSKQAGNDSPSSGQSGTDYCKQWAHKGTCSYSNKCKFLDTHDSHHYRGDRSHSPPPKKSKLSRSSLTEGDWEKSLDQEDELVLERKLQMLQRELAMQDEQELDQKPAKVVHKKQVVKKKYKKESSSSSSSSSSSDSDSSSSSSSSSSSDSSDSEAG